MKKRIDHWKKARFNRSKVNRKPLSKQTKTLPEFLKEIEQTNNRESDETENKTYLEL